MGFPGIIKAGGFDAVIGNPPWVFTREGGFAEAVKKYIDRTYISHLEGSQSGRAKQSGKINLFAVFVLKSIDLLKKNGYLGYIVPNTILRATVYDVVRKYLIDTVKVGVIADLGSGVFEGVTASSVILIIEKAKPDSKHKVRVSGGASGGWAEGDTVLQKSFSRNTSFTFTLYSSDWSDVVVKKMRSAGVTLGGECKIHCGIATGPGKEDFIKSKKLSAAYKPLIEGKDVKRYALDFKDRYILYDRAQLHRARDEKIFLSDEKLVTQRIAGGDNALVVGYDDQQFYTFNSTNAIIKKPGSVFSLKFILGVLNSKLLNWYYIVNFTNRSSLTVNISQTFLAQLPIPRINLSDKADKLTHDKFVECVDLMLASHKRRNSGTLAQYQIDRLDREIAALNQRINDTVYEMYGISGEERQKIESDGLQVAATQD